MKYPKIPTKPYAPWKPQPPAKQIEKKAPLGTLTSQEDSEFTIESLTQHIKEKFPAADVFKLKFHLEISREHGYYDEVYTHLNIHFSTVEMVDDPDYDRKYQNYKKALEKYGHDYHVYKEALKQYHIDEKQYKKDIEQWQLEQAKATISRIEGKKNNARTNANNRKRS